MTNRKKRTTHIRVYKDDVDDIRIKFPKTTLANFFHMSVRTNPFMQMEAALRKKKKNKKIIL